ncbi:hypothetical protein H4Q26_008590 [Puccinia striiformis f. sp. tritici PST-130]|nr:hypothetical protein H4Q26_008590 [Puccinia striiformis f. sp. tritici PST-130]
MLYHQQINLHQQTAEQARVNQFSNNVFQNSHHHQQQQQPTYSNQHQLQSSPLNPFNPNPPHGAVLDASQRYPAAYDAQTGDDLTQIINLMESELSEPYIIYTYRYFLTSWPHLCFLCFSEPTELTEGGEREAIGAIVCKQDLHRGKLNRGYIAMLTTKKEARKRGIARKLVHMAMQRMIADGAQEIVLETEFDNSSALAFYQTLGFIREKRLFAFYLNYKTLFVSFIPSLLLSLLLILIKTKMISTVDISLVILLWTFKSKKRVLNPVQSRFVKSHSTCKSCIGEPFPFSFKKVFWIGSIHVYRNYISLEDI